MIFPFPYSKAKNLINVTNIFVGISSIPYDSSTGFDIDSDISNSRAFSKVYTDIIENDSTLAIKWDNYFNWPNVNNYIGYAYVFIPNSVFDYLVTHRKETVSTADPWTPLTVEQVEVIDFAYSNDHTYNGIDGKFLYAKGVYKSPSSYGATMYANYLFTNNPNP